MNLVLFCRFHFQISSISNGEHFAHFFKIYTNRTRQLGYRHPESETKIYEKSATPLLKPGRQPYQARTAGEGNSTTAAKGYPSSILEYSKILQIKTAFVFHPLKKCKRL